MSGGPRAGGRGGGWLALLALLPLLLATGGCSSLAFWRSDEDRAARAAAAAEARGVPTAPLYELAIDAPGQLDELLGTYLDLGRFRMAPEGESVSDVELERLANAAPAQARALLETEGYFNAEVTVRREPPEPGSALRRVAVRVVPGPRVVVRDVAITSSSPIAAPADPRSDPDRLATLRRNWPLRPGFPFRQDDWASAKVATLRPLLLDGHAAARLGRTQAQIDAVENRASLAVEVDPGPLFRFGAPRVSGLERYDADAVTRLMTFEPGDVYREQALLEWQDRLLKSGLFEGASATIDADPAVADAVPVQVAVKELTQKQATYGIGYSANTGPRASVEYIDRKAFGLRRIWTSKVEWGADRKLVATDLASWPLEGGWRHAYGGSAERLRSTDETRDAWALRAVRSRETSRFDRAWSLEAQHARIDSVRYAADATAGFAQFAWVRRDLDSILLPTDGNTLSVQLGPGYGQGSRRIDDETERARGPFVRAWARWYRYRPVAGGYGTLRLEAGHVLAKSAVSVPDTLLFRAGGDDSVRGYAYRSLGPDVNGAVGSGRVLATGSVEYAHVLLARLPDLLGAVFVDAGQAADRWQDLKPVFGYGVGVRYRSPVGPLRVDVAYGQAVRSVRVHFSVGVTF